MSFMYKGMLALSLPMLPCTPHVAVELVTKLQSV